MNALIASDLDRTLIYSQRFFRGARQSAMCVEMYNGEPISYMTSIAAAALRRLCTTERHVVPSTTRTVEQYSRIDLPGGPFRFAVTSNGGNILNEGIPDPAWRSTVMTRMRDGGPSLEYIKAQLQARIDERWALSLRVAEDLFCYLVVDEVLLPSDFVAQWARWCLPYGWKVSRQGRKIYTVPVTLCKSHAVAEVRRRLIATGDLAADAPLLAAGDGALDAELLESADMAIRPCHGELHALGWQRENLSVTKRAGAAAAEEILEWLANQSPKQSGAAGSRPDEGRFPLACTDLAQPADRGIPPLS